MNRFPKSGMKLAAPRVDYAKANEPGVKLDDGKAPIFQGAIDYFPLALTAVAAISAFGATKYQWKGWMSVPDGENRYANAQYRHAVAQSIDGDYDQESGMLHAAHEAWNALAKLELMQRTGKTLRKPRAAEIPTAPPAAEQLESKVYGRFPKDAGGAGFHPAGSNDGDPTAHLEEYEGYVIV